VSHQHHHSVTPTGVASHPLKSLEDGRPPSIIGSTAALGAGGAAVGKAHQLHDKIGLEKDLSDAVAPGHSGIVALVSDPGAVEIREALAKANGIVEHAVSDVVAKDIRAVADEVENG